MNTKDYSIAFQFLPNSYMSMQHGFKHCGGPIMLLWSIPKHVPMWFQSNPRSDLGWHKASAAVRGQMYTVEVLLMIPVMVTQAFLVQALFVFLVSSLHLHFMTIHQTLPVPNQMM